MKRLIALASLVFAASALAQDADTRVIDRADGIGEGREAGPAVNRREQLPELTPSEMSPELYLYLHEQRRLDDPKQAVRRKAEARSAARDSRIAAMKWYGMSNARPQANPVPFMGTYSPAWVGSGGDRYDWLGIGWPSVTLRIDQNYELRR
jgi:hypothetical protein